MSGIQKTEKIPGKHHTYRRLGCGAANARRFGGRYLQLVTHKNKVKAIILDDREDREFFTNQVLSPSKAREMIGWLARYIALSDPDPISVAIASTKAHAQRIRSEQDTIAKELGL